MAAITRLGKDATSSRNDLTLYMKGTKKMVAMEIPKAEADVRLDFQGDTPKKQGDRIKKIKAFLSSVIKAAADQMPKIFWSFQAKLRGVS